MMPSRLFSRLSVVAVCALTTECRQDDIVARFCADGAPCDQPDSGTVCPSRPAFDATRYFATAVCACDSITAGAPWTIDAFDSAVGPYPGPAEGRADGADLQINDQLNASALTVFGDLTVGGRVQADTSSVTVGGNLRAGNQVAADGSLAIGGNADVAGDLRAGSLSVGGRLTQPATANLDVSGSSAISDMATASVVVEPPCACDDPLDIPAIIDTGRQRATNDAEDLISIVGTAERTLACGEYGFRTVAGDVLQLNLSGPTIFYVSGDVALERLVVNLGANATLDLFVGGGWLIGGPSAIGDPDRPSATRIAIATNGTVNLDGEVTLAGQLIAPTAEVVVPESLEVFGSLFVRRVSGLGDVTVHYDRTGGP